MRSDSVLFISLKLSTVSLVYDLVSTSLFQLRIGILNRLVDPTLVFSVSLSPLNGKKNKQTILKHYTKHQNKQFIVQTS